MAGIGLVLGAGGVVGQAYQAGVLAALEHDWRFDARDVDVIVGTSAGSVTGALLRLGVPAADLAAWAVKAPLSGEHHLFQRIVDSPVPAFVPFQVRQLLRRPPSAPGWHMLSRALRNPYRFRPMAAGLALMAPGRRDILEQVGALRELRDVDWPERDLLICAVRRRDGRRVVFGPDGSLAPSLDLAVAASCAVPGYFAPVRIDSRDYIDGGAHSPTNAATLRGRGLDLVIVVSPMSGPFGSRPDLYAASRHHASAVLRREVNALHADGIRTLVFSPGRGEQDVMGNDFMSADRVNEVIQHSFLAAGARASSPDTRPLMQIATRRRRPSTKAGEPVAGPLADVNRCGRRETRTPRSSDAAVRWPAMSTIGAAGALPVRAETGASTGARIGPARSDPS